MPIQTQQALYLILCKAYGSAVTKGEEHVKLHVAHLADALSYLDGNDNSNRLVEQPLDDLPNAEIEKLFKEGI